MREVKQVILSERDIANAIRAHLGPEISKEIDDMHFLFDGGTNKERILFDSARDFCVIDLRTQT